VVRTRVNRILVAVLVLCSAAYAQPRKLKPGFNLFSKDQDIQLGKEYAAQVEKEKPIVQNSELNTYIQSIGHKLITQPEADNYPYTFKIVYDKSINAFALPGGPTFVNSGLILAAENEAQLAGVMAHEISHVALRHGTNQASKANLIQLPAMLAGTLFGSGSLTGQLAQLGIGLGANSVLLKFSRNAERDADLLGARIMAGAGYNPVEMARFFEKLEEQGGSQSAFAQFLSDHPNPGNRVKEVEKEIQYLPQQRYATDTGQLPRMKKIIEGLPVPKNAAPDTQGKSAPPEAPEAKASPNVRQYQGREFAFSYPDNWKAFQDGNSVTVAPQNGIVGSAIGYGVIVNHYIPQGGGQADLKRDTQLLIRQLQSNNPSMRPARQGSRGLRVDGQSALITTLYSDSPYRGEREIDMLLTVARPTGLFYMVFIAPQRGYRQVQGSFEQMLRSVRFSN
jgi:hypothetical protein